MTCSRHPSRRSSRTPAQSLAVDWTDLESFSRPPPHGTSNCADPEASWGHRKNNLLRSENELFYGYYLSAGIMMPDENGPAVPELTRRATLSSCRHDPVRAFAPVLTAMPGQGILLGDILDDSGYSHRDAGAWAIPLRAAGAQLVQDLHPHDRGPKGSHHGADHRQRQPLLPRRRPARCWSSGRSPAPRRKSRPRTANAKTSRASPVQARPPHRRRRRTATTASQCPAATGKVRCLLRPASMTLDRDRPEILQPPEHPQAVLRTADHHRPAGRARQDRAEARLPVRGLAPLLRPPHRRRTRLPNP